MGCRLDILKTLGCMLDICRNIKLRKLFGSRICFIVASKSGYRVLGKWGTDHVKLTPGVSVSLCPGILGIEIGGVL